MTTIKSVKEAVSGGFWIVTDAEGVKHATKNVFLASLAKQHQQHQTPVHIGSSAGWFYRDLYGIEEAR